MFELELSNDIPVRGNVAWTSRLQKRLMWPSDPLSCAETERIALRGLAERILLVILYGYVYVLYSVPADGLPLQQMVPVDRLRVEL